MSVPTQSEVYLQLLEHLRLAQENAATLGHLARANDDNHIGTGWLAVSELLNRMCTQVTSLATKGRLN